jgi:hypothetical protein
MHFNLLEVKYTFTTNKFLLCKTPLGGGCGVRDVDCAECAMWGARSARCVLHDVDCAECTMWTAWSAL